MSLKEIALSAGTRDYHSKIVNVESHCVSELYWSFLPKNFDTGSVKKCVIELLQERVDSLHDHTNLWTDVKKTQMNFDFELYLKSNKHNKKKILIETLHTGMLKIAQSEKWELKILIEAYHKCLEVNLVYQFMVKGQVKVSPDKTLKMGLWCNWDIDVVEIFWVLFDKEGYEKKRELFISKEPQWGEFVYYLSWKWMDNESVLVENKYKYGDNDKWMITPHPK